MSDPMSNETQHASAAGDPNQPNKPLVEEQERQGNDGRNA